MTESTRQHALGAEHLAGCKALSQAAGWNQNEADWRLMLRIGHGWGLSTPDGTLVASTLVLPYGRFAWISMVLVLPQNRRRGHASRLLRVALADLRERGLLPVLDATPAGREVYRQEGFHDTWTFKRFALEKGEKGVRTNFRTTGKSDEGGRHPVSGFPEICSDPFFRLLRLDGEAFGADRQVLLRDLQRRLPAAALALGESGFVLGRDGREARQLGPLVARDEATALALLQSGLAAVQPPVYVDIVDHAPRLQEWVQAQGFAFQRPFTRMVHGLAAAPGNEKLVYCVAGPELG